MVMTPVRIALIGSPLAGKSSILKLLSGATGVPLIRLPVTIGEGLWKGAEVSRVDLNWTHDGRTLCLATLPGGVPVEGMFPLLRAAERVIFVFDGERARTNDQVRLWNQLSPRWGAGPSAAIVNRTSGSQQTAAELLQAVGACPDLPCLELSAVQPEDGERLRAFILEVAGVETA